MGPLNFKDISVRLPKLTFENLCAPTLVVVCRMGLIADKEIISKSFCMISCGCARHSWLHFPSYVASCRRLFNYDYNFPWGCSRRWKYKGKKWIRNNYSWRLDYTCATEQFAHRRWQGLVGARRWANSASCWAQPQPAPWFPATACRGTRGEGEDFCVDASGVAKSSCGFLP